MFLPSVHKLARAVTKWIKFCDERPARLISLIHHLCEYRQYCCVGYKHHNADEDCFKISILQEIWKTRSQHQGILCILGTHTFVPIRWVCKKQTSVPHSFTEA